MRVTATFLFVSQLLLGQDADTIVLKGDSRSFTLVSQIPDRVEAAAFLSILDSQQPETRHQRASQFLQAYPQSWLLSQAYDALARSAIDLGKLDEALENGHFSLRLSPENPSLLVLMANIEAQQSQFDRALRDENDALEYLSQIERPPNMTQPEWSVTRPQLMSSAYFAKARAEASRGLANTEPILLESAFTDLNSAVAWNAKDSEVLFLRAIIETQLQRKRSAASDLRFVMGTSSALHDKAQKILLILYKQLSDPSVPFESFLKSLPSPAVDATLRADNNRHADPQSLAYGYAGPEACRRCHESEYNAWRQTGMARMLQPYRPENVIGDFSAFTQYSESAEKGSEPDVIRLGVQSRPYFELKSVGGWTRYYVDFTIGSKWQQAYATKLPDGRLQVLPIEYNRLQHQWINYWKMIDPPGSVRANLREFTKFTADTNYQRNCAICHTSQLKADAASAAPMEHAIYRQPGIDCEMCHGPSAWHVKQASRGVLGHAASIDPPVDFRKMTNRDGVRVCAQCHRQSAVREIGEGGELNYSSKTDFVPLTWLRPYDAFSRKAFYKDGRFRETTFIVESFTRSACYLRGVAQCATCHSPHLADFATNQTSLKFYDKPNEMCLGCHAQYRERVAQHSRHSAGSEASQCVTCHMPRIVNALLFKARSHQIEIPFADLTERFGQNESPNICLTCHAEKGAPWAREQLAAWPHSAH